ncbi:unnamed protein product, partial [Amoebophrya sp. A120]
QWAKLNAGPGKEFEVKLSFVKTSPPPQSQDGDFATQTLKFWEARMTAVV